MTSAEHDLLLQRSDAHLKVFLVLVCISVFDTNNPIITPSTYLLYWSASPHGHSSSPEVHPQQTSSDQAQPLTGLPTLSQHYWNNDDLPGVGVAELLLTTAGRLVLWGQEGTNHYGLLHTCSNPENKHRLSAVSTAPSTNVYKVWYYFNSSC